MNIYLLFCICYKFSRFNLNDYYCNLVTKRDLEIGNEICINIITNIHPY
jgi:hypothetical protein